MISLRKQFGRRLRDLRIAKGFNQLYLATLTGVSEDFVSQVERGINTPSFETIEALARVLETDVAALFTFSIDKAYREPARTLAKKSAPRPRKTRVKPARLGD